MSYERGNVKRTRPQKHKNKTAFKNDLHDTSHKIKQINNIEIANVCVKCKDILEWKIKYKKYKLLKVPKKCTKCEQKTIKNAYHIMCLPCAEIEKVCPKCGKTEEILKSCTVDQSKHDAEYQKLSKNLCERKRRTFLRCMGSENNSLGKKNCDGEIICKEEIVAKLESLNIELESDFSSDNGVLNDASVSN